MLTGPQKSHNVMYINWGKREFHTGSLSEEDIAATWSDANRIRKQYSDVIFHFTVILERPGRQAEKFEADDIWVLETPGPGMKER